MRGDPRTLRSLGATTTRRRAGGINAYHLVAALDGLVDGRHVIACGDATATIVPFQLLRVAAGMRLFSNGGCASMGYDLPAALGAAVAVPARPIVCLAGDGSVMMNLQELQTLAAWQCDLLLVILDNGGYLSIRQTQSNFFGREFGASPGSGGHLPGLRGGCGRVRAARRPARPERRLARPACRLVSARGPRVCIAPLDREQEFEPRLRSRMRDGVITTPPLDDVYPAYLPDEVLEEVRASARAL